ncbi:MAG: class I SAM-dependent methyltransferase [Saprospiraceae bacterium]|nr:class I SAM-dependent methyltransferase [Saprospiraceae bacterium]
MDYNLPPVWTQLQQHEVFPTFDHDERARYNFLSNLNRFIATTVAPATKVAYDRRVESEFVATHGRSFQNRLELQEAMQHEPLYQTWAALRRCTMEMRQQNGRAATLRQAHELAAKVENLNRDNDKLILTPNFVQPPYLEHVDNHLMPGSYRTAYFDKDVSNAANYDSGLFVTSGGLLGSLTDGGGKAIAHWVKEMYPDFKPKRILDLGAGLGHNTLPLAQAFPDAEVYAIDASEPFLRYGAARAKALGIENVWFVQMNAENMAAFTERSFDWVQSTMFLHETGGHAIHRITKEINRVLAKGGLTLHIEQPPYTADMSFYEQFMRDWDAYNNAEPFWGFLHDLDPRDLMQEAGVAAENFIQVYVRAINDLDTAQTDATMQEDYGRTPRWHVFGGWKR